MRRLFRFIKFTFIFWVVIASALRPVIVYAHNSYGNHTCAASSVSSHQNPIALNRYSPLSKTMHVLDKEKVDAVCLNTNTYKKLVFFEIHSFKTINTPSADRLSFQSPILRI